MVVKKTDKFVVWIAVVVFLAFLAILCGSCHTIHGVGSDLRDWSSAYVERPGE